MFQFPTFASPKGYPASNGMGCPIRTSADLRSFAAPHSFSQLTTSFVASKSLGIHHAPFFRFLFILRLFAFLYLFSIIRLSALSLVHPLLSTYPHPVKDRLAHIRATEVMKASNLPCPNTGNNL